MRISRASMLLSCAAVLAATSGCGGSSSSFKSDYEQQRPTLNQLGTDVQNALQSGGSKTNAQIETEFTGLAQRAASGLSGLSKLKADGKSATSFATLKSGLAKVQQDLGGIAAAARANDPSAAKSATQTLVADATTLMGAGQQLKSELGIKK